MCGIVGALSASPIEPDRVAMMRDRLVHRGPDDQGLWLAEDARVCLGFRRLAIVDLRPEANQPFHSQDGRFVIVFNGEIYNFQCLRDELASRGVGFRTRSDTEVLVEAFRAWGERCLDRLSGMFAFGIWDRQERRLFCARDRVGEKPFYYSEVGNSFIFGSELKALTAWPGFRRNICYPALADFLSFGFVPDPKSIWEGCYKLPPGHCMWVDLPPGEPPQRLKVQPYWDFTFAPDESVSDWGPAILDTLQSASKEMSFADVPVGAFLSGGVDSSSVTAALAKAGCSVKTFTVGFENPDFDERAWAREVARLYQTDHSERVVHPEDVTSVFQKMLWHYDEPFNDYSYLPTFYVCREARQSITVALSGDGGDELFAGYTKYRRLRLREDTDSFFPWPVRRLLHAGAQLMPERNPVRRTLEQHGMPAMDMLADMFVFGFRRPALLRAARGPLAQCLKHYGAEDVVAPLLRKAPPQEIGMVNAMRYLDMKLTLAGSILVKVDRASMAVSLEVRPVYLHRDLIALASRIPPSVLADRHQAKKALKSALRPWLPDSILYRRKQGFGMPLKKWINGDLRLLLGAGSGGALAEFLDPNLLDALLRTHASGDADFTSTIHSLVFLGSWLEKWVGNEAEN